MTKYFQVDKGYYKLKIDPDKKALELPVLLDIPATSQIEAERKVNQLEKFLKKSFNERIRTTNLHLKGDEIQNQINGLLFKVMNFMNVDKEVIVSEQLVISNIKYYLDTLLKLNRLKLKTTKPETVEVRLFGGVNRTKKDNYHSSKDIKLNKILFDNAIKYYYHELIEFTQNQNSYYNKDLTEFDPFNLADIVEYLKEISILYRDAVKNTTLNLIFVKSIISYLQESTIVTVRNGKTSGEQYEIAYYFLKIYDLASCGNDFEKRGIVDFIKALFRNHKKKDN